MNKITMCDMNKITPGRMMTVNCSRWRHKLSVCHHWNFIPTAGGERLIRYSVYISSFAKPPLATSCRALTCLQDLLRQVQCYVERLPVDAKHLFRTAHPHARSEPREALTQLLHFWDSALRLLSEGLHILEQRNQRWMQEQPLLQGYAYTQGPSNDPANWRGSAVYRLPTAATQNVET